MADNISFDDLDLSQYSGYLFRVDPNRDYLIKLIPHLSGLREPERYYLSMLIALCQSSQNRIIDQALMLENLKRSGKKAALTTLNARALTLLRLGILERYEIPRPRSRTAVLFNFADIATLLHNRQLTSRQSQIDHKLERLTPELQLKDPNQLLDIDENIRTAFSRKVTHIILRRCTKNPDALGKKIAIHLPGYGESVGVIQRTSSGIPAMDGSEDVTQQAILTQFKLHLAKLKTHIPFDIQDVKNEWIVDLRLICRAQNLKPSSGNMLTLAKRLYQLRYNTFEIFFNPNGRIHKQFNFQRNGDTDADYYLDEVDNTLHRLNSDRYDQYFLSKLEPVRDEIDYRGKQLDLLPDANDSDSIEDSLDFEADELDDSDFDVNTLLRDENGRIYRFYRISFHDSVFKECIDDSLGQIHIQPPSMLSDSRPTARLLVYMANRILTKKRSIPFESTWQQVAEEIQPAAETLKNVFQNIEYIFRTQHKRVSKVAWTPETPVKLHGYFFKTKIPPGKARKRAEWRMIMWRDPNDEFVGDNGPAATAAYLDFLKEKENLNKKGSKSG